DRADAQCVEFIDAANAGQVAFGVPQRIGLDVFVADAEHQVLVAVAQTGAEMIPLTIAGRGTGISPRVHQLGLDTLDARADVGNGVVLAVGFGAAGGAVATGKDGNAPVRVAATARAAGNPAAKCVAVVHDAG